MATDSDVRLHAPPSEEITVGCDTATADLLREEATDVLAGLLDGPPAVELTSSCTHALEAAATVLDIREGDEVIVPAFAFPSVANPFGIRGASLRFADCDPATGNITTQEVRRCATERTRAVVCMHYGGVACDVDSLVPLCRDAGWHLIEDAAHGLFGSRSGTPLGRFGTLGAFSFHRTKNISCGDGGALVVNDEALLDRVAVALDKGTNRAAYARGSVAAYEWSGLGSAWRMPDALVPLLAGQLGQHVGIQAARHRIWDVYASELTDWARATGTRLPTVHEGVEHPAHLFWLLLPVHLRRHDFVSHCAERGIEVARHFGSLPRSTFGALAADPADVCPTAGLFGDQLVRLPLHPALSERDVERVLDAVTGFVPEKR